MQRIVIDTNVIVSALIGSSYPAQIIYNIVLSRKALMCISSEVFAEYNKVLHRERFSKYTNFVTNAEIVLNKIDELSMQFIPFQKISIIKDEPDNRFLELGITANAGFLITGNHKHFKLSEYGLMKIVNPQDYIANYYKE